MRRAKVDANQADIVRALRQAGASVQSLATIGKGCPDLLIGFRGRDWKLEVKRDEKASETPDQRVWQFQWRGSPVYRVESVAQALALLGVQ